MFHKLPVVHLMDCGPHGVLGQRVQTHAGHVGHKVEQDNVDQQYMDVHARSIIFISIAFLGVLHRLHT